MYCSRPQMALSTVPGGEARIMVSPQPTTACCTRRPRRRGNTAIPRGETPGPPVTPAPGRLPDRYTLCVVYRVYCEEQGYTPNVTELKEIFTFYLMPTKDDNILQRQQNYNVASKTSNIESIVKPVCAYVRFMYVYPLSSIHNTNSQIYLIWA
jgi:hypothetical protein